MGANEAVIFVRSININFLNIIPTIFSWMIRGPKGYAYWTFVVGICIFLGELTTVYKAYDRYKIGGGGVKPHFSPRHTEIWIWGWANMVKKVYEKRGKQTFYFRNRKNSHFSHDAPKFGFGDGKKWGKSIWKEREKVFVLTNCCTLLSLFSAF